MDFVFQISCSYTSNVQFRVVDNEQVIIVEDNDRNSQYTIVRKDLIEKCQVDTIRSTINRPILWPIQSFMVYRAFHREIIREITQRNFSQLWAAISMISHRGFVGLRD